MTDRRSVQGESLRVLVVDDDPPMVRTLVDILALAGHCVHSGALRRGCPGGCAQCRLRLCSDGCAHARLCRHRAGRQLHSVQPDLPVALMTAYAEESLLQEGFCGGRPRRARQAARYRDLLAFLKALGRDRTIALVDDDISFAQSLGDILQARGYHVQRITATLTCPCARLPMTHIVLLDIVLDGVVGTDLLRAIRQKGARFARHPDDGPSRSLCKPVLRP